MSQFHPFAIFPLGDAALTVEFSNSIEVETNDKVHRLFHQLKDSKIPYIIDLVPAYSSLTVHYDVKAIHRGEQTAFEWMAEMIENLTEEKSRPSTATKTIDIPACYEKEYAPDLYSVSQMTNLSPEEVIAIHTSLSYRVFMMGFLPGFAYMGETDAQISVPRKPQPRPVKQGAIGIAGRQTGIYPFDTPGGWQIIAATPLKIFTLERSQPILLAPGDQVRFYSISADEFKDYQRRTS